MKPGLKENTNWLKGTVMKIVKPFFQIMISILITVFLGKYLLENVLSNKKPLSLLMTVLGLALLSNVYKLLIKRYDLIPHQTVFIDDKEENIKSAEKLGIHGIHFQNCSQLRKDLQMLKLL